MKVAAVSWPKVDVWPRLGCVRLVAPLVIALYDGRSLYLPGPGENGEGGLYSDGASVPNVLWGVLDATPVELLLMGLGHDGAFRSDACWTMPDETRCPIAIDEANDLASALAIYSGCSRLDAAKIRWGLGVAAGPHWHRKALGWRPDAEAWRA